MTLLLEPLCHCYACVQGCLGQGCKPALKVAWIIDAKLRGRLLGSEMQTCVEGCLDDECKVALKVAWIIDAKLR